jgi:NADP-dependent 3-hydroxy acid dehydrogenase YdfG
LEQASAKLGSVTGIIHGAGNIADKLIENKSAQDFETVYRAKVEGLTNLLKVVSPGQLEHLILFSSVVAFYGNVGQADYALANEILNKTAYLFKRRFPNCRVLAFNWGPWDGGMVTPELQRLLTQQAVDTIPATKGAQMFLDELTAADTQVVQVVIGSPLIQNPKLLISL